MELTDVNKAQVSLCNERILTLILALELISISCIETNII
jgi:hypothetical protein